MTEPWSAPAWILVRRSQFVPGDGKTRVKVYCVSQKDTEETKKEEAPQAY
jgi:hypothetical protein